MHFSLNNKPAVTFTKDFFVNMAPECLKCSFSTVSDFNDKGALVVFTLRERV